MANEIRQSETSRRAFTLIELLVVVAILALLVSILMPSLKRAKDLAKRAVCLSNLRNSINAMAMYAGDYNGWIGANGSVRDAAGTAYQVNWTAYLSGQGVNAGSPLQPGGGYMSDPSVALCPAYAPFAWDSKLSGMSQKTFGMNEDGWRMWCWGNTPRANFVARADWPSAGPTGMTFYYNLFEGPVPGNATRYAAPSLAHEILLADTVRCPTSAAYGNVQLFNFTMRVQQIPHSSSGGPHARHLETADLGFWDGHAETHTPDDLAVRDKFQTFWVGDPEHTLFDAEYRDGGIWWW